MRRIAIIGFEESSGAQVPHDPAVEKWIVNCEPRWWPKGLRVDRAFQLHERHSLSAPEEAYLATCVAPLYTFWPWEGIANPRIYPLEAVKAMPGVIPGGFFACSFAYAIALACWEHGSGGGRFFTDPTGRSSGLSGLAETEGVAELGCYGVELQDGSARERLLEYVSVMWWLGYAAGLGIRVTVPPGSNLFTYPHDYGREYHAEGAWVAERTWRAYAVLQREVIIENEAWARGDYADRGVPSAETLGWLRDNVNLAVERGRYPTMTVDPKEVPPDA